MRKPVIDKVQRNGKDAWTVAFNNGGADGPSYELQVRHYAPEDDFTFVAWDMGDDIELVSAEEFETRRMDVAIHASCDDELSCGKHGWNDPTPEQDPDDDGWLCKACRAACLNFADAFLADRARIADAAEAETGLLLRAAWDRFVAEFNPAVTL